MIRRTVLATIFFVFASAAFGQSAIDLSGKWQFEIDPSDRGAKDGWASRDLARSITLPGILQSQGYGNEIAADTPWVLSLYDKNWRLRADYAGFTAPGGVTVPFLSQPPRHYLGPAWYSRTIDIPAGFAGQRIVLFLERPHWESTVYLDGVEIGSNRSLVAPHELDLGSPSPGRHRLSIRIDNRLIMPYRPDAHSVSDSLGMSWNGIVGRIELRSTPLVWIDDAQVFPDPKTKVVRIDVSIGNVSGSAGYGRLLANGKVTDARWTESGGKASIELSFPDAGNWNEFSPELHPVEISLAGPAGTDRRKLSFGFARIGADGNQFTLNGRPIYLRGTHHGGDFPLTGYPPTDVAYWRKILKINKDWGINHIRFHSFCPPEAAFQAADELGVYLQPEPGMWNEVSPGTPMEKMLYEETDRMIRAYGNHPSFVLLSPSNEPKGRWKEAFDKWIGHYRGADPRRLYTNGTGHTEREVPNLHVGTDYLVMQRIGQKMLRGNSAWFGKDYGASLEGIDIPVASHELGQWVAYPDFSVIEKFTGYMRPGNYEIFRESARRKGVLAKNKDFAIASGRFQLNCYKEEIEANLRTPKMYGYQLLDLHDYLGQGTALVGLLDAFWEEKGYVTPSEFRKFNNETVPLARLYKRVVTSDERLEVPVEIAHFGEKPIENAVVNWRLVDENGADALAGSFPASTIPIGKNIRVGTIDANLGAVWRPNERLGGARPMRLKLVVSIAGTAFQNDWNIWLFGAKAAAPEPKNITVTHDWFEAETNLKKGGKVLFIPRKADLSWWSPPLDTVPVFWNRLMNPGWSRMLGMWIDRDHPALAEFPTEDFNDWQWTEIIRNARAVNLDSLPSGLQPIVQPIDDWNRNYRLGLIFEARVGRGKLMVSSADLESDLDQRIAARQLRRSILNYMASDRFSPKTTVAPDAIRGLLFSTRIMIRLGAVTDVKEQVLAFDGDPNTFWIAGDPKKERSNQEFAVRFPKPVDFSGFVVMPRQNHRDHEGDVRGWSLMVSDDGVKWSEAARGELQSTFDPQRVDIGRTVRAKFVKFVSLSGFGADKMTAIAEFAFIYAGPKLPDDRTDVEYKRVRSASADVDESIEEKKPVRPKKP